MVALKSSEFDTFLARGKQPIVLIFGPDAGLIRRACASLGRKRGRGSQRSIQSCTSRRRCPSGNAGAVGRGSSHYSVVWGTTRGFGQGRHAEFFHRGRKIDQCAPDLIARSHRGGRSHSWRTAAKPVRKGSRRCCFRLLSGCRARFGSPDRSGIA